MTAKDARPDCDWATLIHLDITRQGQQMTLPFSFPRFKDCRFNCGINCSGLGVTISGRKTDQEPIFFAHCLWRPQRAAAPLQLMLVCTSDEGRSRGFFRDTAPRATGRSDGRDREVWMQFEPCCPDGVLNVRRRAHGEKCAADRDSSHPTGHTSCPQSPFASLPVVSPPLRRSTQPYVS